jgi:hypothetical protein
VLAVCATGQELAHSRGRVFEVMGYAQPWRVGLVNLTDRWREIYPVKMVGGWPGPYQNEGMAIDSVSLPGTYEGAEYSASGVHNAMHCRSKRHPRA